MIRAENLGRRFGDFWAIRNVSFELRPGEVFGLLGPNGAGKTTTVRLLTSLISPSEGSASLDGFDIERRGLGKADLGHMRAGGALGFCQTLRNGNQKARAGVSQLMSDFVFSV